jgi:hypothetical protein
MPPYSMDLRRGSARVEFFFLMTSTYFLSRDLDGVALMIFVTIAA